MNSELSTCPAWVRSSCIRRAGVTNLGSEAKAVPTCSPGLTGALGRRMVAEDDVAGHLRVTDAINTSGGSRTAALVAEDASSGDIHLTAMGLGSYIVAKATDAAVTLFNRFLWRPLYAFGERRLRLG